MAYGNKAGTNYEGLSIATLPPGIHKGFELSDIKSDKATKADGTEGKRILTFLFTGPDGLAHQHTEWEVLPTDNEAEKKEDNLVKRVGHILRKFVSAEVVAANNATSWDTYVSWVLQTLGANYKGIKLDLKIVASVYQGKPQTPAFPGYIPFVVKSGEPLSLSPKEVQSINEYNAALSATPDTEKGGGTIGVPAGAQNIDTDF